MSECIFCKIIKGEVPCHKVYEDENVVAFLDIHPVSHGHTLVLPKKHYSDFINTPPDVLSDIMAIAQKLTPSIMEVVGAPAVNIGINNGSEAGQAVFHTHVHIIPRKPGDGLQIWGGKDYIDGEVEIVAKKIREKII